MVLYDQPNLSAGFDEVLISTSNSVPMFPVMILLFTFFVILLGGSNNQKRRLGTADYPFWSILAGISTSLLALLMSLGGGIINSITLGVVFAITILCGVWFFMSSTKGEL